MIWLLYRQQSQTRALLEQQAVSQRAVQLRQLDLIDKSVALVRAADPWQYQQIQAMDNAGMYDEVYDPSPEAEARRIAERQSRVDEMEEELNAQERDALADLFPGLSN